MPNYTHRTVAVIIPVYCGTFIEEALASVMGQCRPPDQVILVDDGSPDQDRLAAALARWRRRITLIRQPNAGAAAARNAALAAASTDWVAFLDADDRWAPDFLASQMTFLDRRPALDLVWADATIVGDTALAGHTFMSLCPSSGPVTLEGLLAQTCNVITSTVVARRKTVMSAGAFDVELRRGQDFDLWLRLVAEGARAAYRTEVLGVRRVHGANLSGSRRTELERALRVFDKALRTLSLTPRERNVAQLRVHTLAADLACEHGKMTLIRGDYVAARRWLDSAHRQVPTWKLAVTRLGLRVAPHVVRRLYLGRSAAAHEASAS